MSATLGKALVIVSATGLVTGLGGKYWFLVPLFHPPSGDYGKAAFSTTMPGVWTGPVSDSSRTTDYTTFTWSGIKVGIATEFCLTTGTMGLDTDPNTNFNGLKPTWTVFDWGNNPGPLGPYSGWMVLGLGVLGAGMWAYAEI